MLEQLTLNAPARTNFINNTWTASAGAGVPTLNPADQSDIVGTVPDSTPEDVKAAIDAAREALPGWAATPGPVRGDILRRWSELIEEHLEELARLITREMGKPLAESRGELGRARMEIDYAAGEGTRIHGVTIPSRIPGVSIATQREPIGVVGAITPWNFPAVAPVRKIAPALVFGNTVVLKPALETPQTALVLAGLLREAGLPEGVLNVVSGRGSTVGSQLTEDPRVAGISFTGSTSVGRTVNEAMARRLGSVQLELGGKNAAYVHSAEDLRAVAAEITSASVQATGQRCTSISRVLVREAIADDLVELLVESWSGLVIGPGDAEDTEVGPLVNQSQLDRVSRYVQQGIEEGAVRVTPDRSTPDGLYFAPTVLDRVTPEMTVAREEIFGPVLTVTRVNDDDEAIRVVNDTDYGLAAAVFSEDLETAMRFSREVHAGMVHINHGTVSQPHVPFGGMNESGVGPFSIGLSNVEFFTQSKTVYAKDRSNAQEGPVVSGRKGL